jgi:hypothetical protein
MLPISKISTLTCAVALGGFCLLTDLGRAGAQQQPEPTRTARGGALAKAGRHQFEVFFYNTGLRVFLLDSTGSPIDASNLTGTATFYHPNSPNPWFSRAIPGATPAGQPASTSLDLTIDLGTVPPTGAKVVFEIAGFSDSAETTTTFTVPLEFVATQAQSAAAQPSGPRGAVAPSPHYVYGPGYYGYGYYNFLGPQTAPARATSPTSVAVSTPTRRSSSSRSSSTTYRDWSTGRNSMRLAKPWLRPID